LSTIIESLVFLQFDYHRRCENHVQCRSSLDRILLFRFPRHQQTTPARPGPFLLTQLSAQSSPCCDILSRLYSGHNSGAQRPTDDALKRCLIEMLTVGDGRPIYLIIDALDECPDTTEVPFTSEPNTSAVGGTRWPSDSKFSYLCHKSPRIRHTRFP